MTYTFEHGRRVRPSIVDSIFFPGEKNDLKIAVKKNLGIKPAKTGAIAILSPHAAWQHAGAYIGSAFASAKTEGIKNVVVLSPIHRQYSEGIFLSDSDSFSTPLGEIEVARELVTELSECSTRFYLDDSPHLEEHSIEVLLPFIQTLFPEARLVPMIFGRTSTFLSDIAAKALSCVFGHRTDETMFVVSSNLSSNNTLGKSEKEAETFSEFLEKGDRKGLLKAYQEGQTRACGTACAASIMAFLGSEAHAVPLCNRGYFLEGGRTVHYGAYGFFTN